MSLAKSGDTRLSGIHFLRGVAALMIVIFHLHHLMRLTLPPGFGFIATHFAIGVQLFFVLSAFSLMYVHFGRISNASSGITGELRGYYAKRFLRIAPLFYFMLALMSVLHVLKFNGQFDSAYITKLVCNATFVFNFIPEYQQSIVWAGWTIGVEMLFYLVLPLIAILFTRKFSMLLLCFVVGVIGILAHTTLQKMNAAFPGIATHSIVRNMFYFCAGCLSYLFYKDSLSSNRKIITARIAMALALALALFLASPLGRPLISTGRPDTIAWGVVLALTCLWLSLNPARFCALAPFQWAGERSYSIYLWHPVVIYAMRDCYQPIISTLSFMGTYAFFACFIATIVPLFIVSEISYRFIERPFIDIGKRYAKKCSAAGAAPPSTITVPPSMEAPFVSPGAK